MDFRLHSHTHKNSVKGDNRKRNIICFKEHENKNVKKKRKENIYFKKAKNKKKNFLRQTFATNIQRNHNKKEHACKAM